MFGIHELPAEGSPNDSMLLLPPWMLQKPRLLLQRVGVAGVRMERTQMTQPSEVLPGSCRT